MPRTRRFDLARLSLEPLEPRFALSGDLAVLHPVDAPAFHQRPVEIGGMSIDIPEALLKELAGLPGAADGWAYIDLDEPYLNDVIAANAAIDLPTDVAFQGETAVFDALMSLANNPLPAAGTSSIHSGVEDDAVVSDGFDPQLSALAIGLSLADTGRPPVIADLTPAIPAESRLEPLEWRAESASVRKAPHFSTPAFAHHGSPEQELSEPEVEEEAPEDAEPPDDDGPPTE